jgi:hypothetical protein
VAGGAEPLAASNAVTAEGELTMLGERLGDIKEVGNDGLITYRNQEFGPGEFRYLATRVTDAHGFNVPLAPGLKVCIHINPFNLDECFVSHAESGAYIGLAARWQTVCKTNDLSQCSRDEIGNAYDNALRYTDHFLGRIIETLKTNQSKFKDTRKSIFKHV